MSKTVELARHLSTLNINNMYKTDFYWTWDKTDDEIDAIFTVADALRDLRERNKSTRVFDSGLGISIFRDNSTRTRFSFASACNFLGLEEQVLDEKKSQIAHGETVRETANMVSFMADVIGIRDDMFIGEGHKYQKTFMDAVKEGYRDGILEQQPTLVNLQCDVDHPTQCMADMLHISVSRVYSVATFYENFSLEPKGKHIIKVCDGTACHVRKSGPIYDAIYEYLKLDGKRRTSADGVFTLETVACLGACGLAPVMTVDGEVYAKMTPETALAELEAIRGKEAAE